MSRCPWPGNDQLLISYHDSEWGVPLHDDRALFEFLVLDGFQAGLSWKSVLHKRDAFRRAFGGFDPELVVRFSEIDLERLLQNPEIIRNRAKVRAAVTNARAFLEVRDEFGSFDRFIWRFAGGSAARQPMGNSVPSARSLGGIRPHGQGTGATALQVCGRCHLLCFYAGNGDGERPPGDLSPVGRGTGRGPFARSPGITTDYFLTEPGWQTEVKGYISLTYWLWSPCLSSLLGAHPLPGHFDRTAGKTENLMRLDPQGTLTSRPIDERARPETRPRSPREG